MLDAFQFAGRWLSFNDALKIALSCSRVLRGQSLSILLVIMSIPGAPLGLQVDSVVCISSRVMSVSVSGHSNIYIHVSLLTIN